MRWIKYILICLIAGALAHFVTKHPSKQLKDQYEVILFTLSLCEACAVYETDIVSAYKSHALADKAPLKLVNMDEAGSGPVYLSQPVTTVPTAIIFKNGREVARMPGLVDKFHFYAFVRDITLPDQENIPNF